MTADRAYRDEHAVTFDEQPDHGLRNPGIRAAWQRLLRPGGSLLLVEGRWHTGAGLSAAQASQAVRRHRAGASVTMLGDPRLWGAPLTDERYLIASPR